MLQFRRAKYTRIDLYIDYRPIHVGLYFMQYPHTTQIAGSSNLWSLNTYNRHLPTYITNFVTQNFKTQCSSST